MNHPSALPLYRRIGAQIEVTLSLLPRQSQSVRQWLIDAKINANESGLLMPVERYVHPGWHFRRWWYAGEVWLLGFSIGAGVAYTTKTYKVDLSAAHTQSPQ